MKHKNPGKRRRVKHRTTRWPAERHMDSRHSCRMNTLQTAAVAAVAAAAEVAARDKGRMRAGSPG